MSIETKKGMELVEKEEFVFGLIAKIANRFSHHGPVLVFDITVIILFGRSRPGEGDLFFLTGPNELVIDELPTVIRIDPQKRKGKPCSNLPGFKDPISHFFDRLSFQSSRSRHRSNQITTGVSAIVGNQIDFTESWFFLIPSSQSAKVRTGIRCFRRVPGLV